MPRTTPQASLELITYIMPLDLHILETGMNAYNRLKQQLDEPWKPKNTKHQAHLKITGRTPASIYLN